MSRIIALEGINGTGKSTVAATLCQRYPSLKYLRSPGGTTFGERIRAVLGDEPAKDPLAKQLAYSAAQREWVTQVVRPLLDAGQPVLADRTTMSMFAYGVFDGLNMVDCSRLADLVGFPFRDTVLVLLTCSPDVAYRRARQRTEKTVGGYHSLTPDQLGQIQGRYLEAVMHVTYGGTPHQILDTTDLTPDETVERVVDFLMENGLLL